MALTCLGCMNIPAAYSEINTVTIKPVWPEGYEDLARAGVNVSVQNILNGSSSSALTDDGGKVIMRLPDGLYLISTSDRKGSSIFNGTADKVSISGDSEITLPLERSEGGSIVIKEIYVGGCSMAPKEGTYQTDKYVILHNNIDETVYLDSLCFGTASASGQPLLTIQRRQTLGHQRMRRGIPCSSPLCPSSRRYGRLKATGRHSL